MIIYDSETNASEFIEMYWNVSQLLASKSWITSCIVHIVNVVVPTRPERIKEYSSTWTQDNLRNLL